jgi:protein O-GlcNAc transferase
MFQRIAYEGCPLCESKETEEHHVGDGTKHKLYRDTLNPIMMWRKCRTCSHVYTDGYWPNEALAELFKDTHDTQVLCANMEEQRSTAAHVIDKIVRYTGINGKWLDVGFGNGALLFTALEYGFQPVGLELRPEAAERMTAYGIQSFAKDISAVEFDDGEFKVISMADVLEHMPFPAKALRSARRLLKPEGVLFLSMPNMGSPVWAFHDANKANPYWYEIEHYHNFSRTRLYDLLIETGFTPARYGVSERYRMCMEVIAR